MGFLRDCCIRSSRNFFQKVSDISLGFSSGNLLVVFIVHPWIYLILPPGFTNITFYLDVSGFSSISSDIPLEISPTGLAEYFAIFHLDSIRYFTEHFSHEISLVIPVDIKKNSWKNTCKNSGSSIKVIPEWVLSSESKFNHRATIMTMSQPVFVATNKPMRHKFVSTWK